MKYLKKIISTTLVTMLLSTSLSFANFDKEANFISKQNVDLSFYKYKPICINDSFNVQMKKIVENSEFFKTDMSYPLLKIEDKYINKKGYKCKVIENINKQICNYVVDFSEKVKQESEEYKKQYEDIFSKSGQDYVKYKYEAYSDYQVTYNKDNLISIPIKTYKFTGGAHGITYLKSYNYDLLSGKEIKLKDVFKKDVDYKEIVNSFIKDEIEKNKDIYFSNSEGFKGISDNQDFYIDNDGIVVYFQVYDIAPYYVGIPRFKMTCEEFGKYFK